MDYHIGACPPLCRCAIRLTAWAPQDISPGGQRAQGVGAALCFRARIIAAYRRGHGIKLSL
jgi:hypothetical protein